MEWKPASAEDVREIVRRDLALCDAEQTAAFHRFAVEPYAANIDRYGRLESVIVVACRNNEVIYWEDVELGFNISPIDENGTILKHWCNEDELGRAVSHWVDG
jgi:hypothetical protein